MSKSYPLHLIHEKSEAWPEGSRSLSPSRRARAKFSGLRLPAASPSPTMAALLHSLMERPLSDLRGWDGFDPGRCGFDPGTGIQGLRGGHGQVTGAIRTGAQ